MTDTQMLVDFEMPYTEALQTLKNGKIILTKIITMPRPTVKKLEFEKKNLYIS